MKVKTLLSILTVCVLLIASLPIIALAAATSSTSTSTSTTSKVSPGTTPAGQSDKNSILGKITAVSEAEITLALATIEKPANSDGTKPAEKPARDGSSRPEKPAASDTSISPRPEPPAGAPDGTKVRGAGRGGMNMTFADKTTAYALSGSVSVKKGMGDSEETIGVSELAADDVVRIKLDSNGQVTVIRVMTAGTRTQSAKSGDSSAE